MANTRQLQIPAYQHHKGSGQAKVRIKGKDVYLGLHGSDESRRRYGKLIAEFVATGDLPLDFCHRGAGRLHASR